VCGIAGFLCLDGVREERAAVSIVQLSVTVVRMMRAFGLILGQVSPLATDVYPSWICPRTATNP
jgi:hypothetical protein